MAFAPTKPWKLPFITTWGGSPNRNLPTNSAEEAKIVSDAQADEPIGAALLGGSGTKVVGGIRTQLQPGAGHHRAGRIGHRNADRALGRLCPQAGGGERKQRHTRGEQA